MVDPIDPSECIVTSDTPSKGMNSSDLRLWEKLDPVGKRVLEVKNMYHGQLMAIPGVVAIGTGREEKDGALLDRLVIKAYFDVNRPAAFRDAVD